MFIAKSGKALAHISFIFEYHMYATRAVHGRNMGRLARNKRCLLPVRSFVATEAVAYQLYLQF